MSFETQLKDILRKINDFKATANNSLPQNTFYLDENQILCRERKNGVSRFPYDADGLVVWATSNGQINAYDSMFNIFRELNNNEDASIAFFGGLRMKNGRFFPVSLFDCHSQLFEETEVKRYVVYSLRYAYYIADTEDVAFAMRLHVSSDKHIHFALFAFNKSESPKDIYMMTCIDAWLSYLSGGGAFDIMNRFGKRYDNGNFLLRFNNESMVISRDFCGKRPDAEYLTAKKSDVLGASGRLMSNAEKLKTGVFERQSKAANSTDIPVCAESVHYTLDSGETVRREFELQYFHSLNEAENAVNHKPDVETIDSLLEKDEESAASCLNAMKMKFSDYNGNLNANVFNSFVRTLQKQISFCALGKNYAGSFIGMRDVMQQLESSLVWQPKESRSRFINALDNILEDGRPPRQFSERFSPDKMPIFDLRKFIDQGVWIITALYTYLSFTDDFSILDEKCGYYVADSANTHIIARSETVDTVLEHIIKVMDYLCSNIDEKTCCLHTLYGDWNDALDGLGKSKDGTSEYGNGVSVMATLQLYQNCGEISEILKHIGKFKEKIAEYSSIREKIKNGLFKYAVDVNEKGERRVIHGWGDNVSYKVGSFNDMDGIARYSSTANSFWAISGMLKNDLSMKEAIKSAFNALDSDYGIMTFDKPFDIRTLEYVGRLARITPGTFENAGAYVHAAMFAAMALFIMGESKKAWRQMELGCVLSHENCSKSPFVMPNSYFKNDEYEMDGESFSDWYTGSGTVFVKNLIKFGFGVCPVLDGLFIQTANYMPTDSAFVDIIVKGHTIKVVYSNKNNRKRIFRINGEEVSCEYDEIMETPKLFIPSSEIKDGMIIEVSD